MPSEIVYRRVPSSSDPVRPLGPSPGAARRYSVIPHTPAVMAYRGRRWAAAGGTASGSTGDRPGSSRPRPP